MDLTRRCRLIHGGDSYQSYRELTAVRTRFLQQNASSYLDYMVYDLEETSIDTIRQTFLTVPFFVQTRLFVLKNTFAAPKSTHETLQKLLEQITDATYVVLYEPKACDKRLSFYTWLTKHVKVQEYPTLTEAQLPAFIHKIAHELQVTVAPDAQQILATAYGTDSWRLANELTKLSLAARALQKEIITTELLYTLSRWEDESSLFRLTDALRAGSRAEVMQLLRQFRASADPLYISATITSQLRTLAKLILAMQKGATSPQTAAQIGGIEKPFVAKLLWPTARTLKAHDIKKIYNLLADFDASAKDGSAPAELGIMLLALRLHGTLQK